MSATGKTPNFNIPVYNAGDTANYLTSYNNAMSIIDGQMQANKSAAAVAQSAVDALEETVNNQAEEIAEVKETADSGAITWYPMTIQNTNAETMTNNHFGANTEVIFVGGTWGINKTYANIPNKVTNGVDVWVPLAYINNVGENFSIMTGIENVIINPSSGIINFNNSATYTNATGYWKIGSTIYFGINMGGFSSNTNTIVNVTISNTWYIQP